MGFESKEEAEEENERTFSFKSERDGWIKGGRGEIQVKCTEWLRGIMWGFKVQHKAERSVGGVSGGWGVWSVECISFTLRSLWRQHVNSESEGSGAMQRETQPDCFQLWELASSELTGRIKRRVEGKKCSEASSVNIKVNIKMYLSEVETTIIDKTV